MEPTMSEPSSRTVSSQKSLPLYYRRRNDPPEPMVRTEPTTFTPSSRKVSGQKSLPVCYRGRNDPPEPMVRIEPTTSTPSNSTVSSQGLLPLYYRGWNDPPESTVLSSLPGTSKRRSLSERVAFPLFPPQCRPLPPPPKMTPAFSASLQKSRSSLVASTRSAATKPATEPDFDKDLALTEVTAALESVIRNEILNEKNAQKVRKMVDTMRANWVDDKFDNVVRKMILNMSRAMSRRDIDRADKIHIDLVLQHTSACIKWIGGIRHIIFQMRRERSPTLTDIVIH